jgi:hypothetical protein
MQPLSSLRERRNKVIEPGTCQQDVAIGLLTGEDTRTARVRK